MKEEASAAPDRRSTGSFPEGRPAAPRSEGAGDHLVVRTARPIGDPRKPHGDLLPSEESATLWLWTWPSLLGWPRPVHWLFSPVVGNRTHPGDLWGLDDDGALLIVETKLHRCGRRTDPFADFVRYADASDSARVWSSEALAGRWEGLYRQEQVFLSEHLPLFASQSPPAGLYPGVVPYSRHRLTIWRWQSIYRDEIAPLFTNGSYERRVRRALERRRVTREVPPIFVGFVATAEEGEPRLSRRGREAYSRLRSRVGPGRVLLRSVRADMEAEQLRITCWTAG